MTAASLVDLERLGRWCETRLPGSGAVDVRRLAEGHSNLTYVVRRDDREWILRRPPAGPLLPTAHDVLREHRVLDLLARSDVPVRVPRVTAVCEDESVLVHGDYKLDNVVVGPAGRARVVAVLDWEMATVGDTRAELGYLLSFWPEPGRTYPLGGLATASAGFPGRGELVAGWEQGTGRQAGATTWFETLAVWKLAVLLEASYHRYRAGSTDDPFFATLDEGVPALLAHAREVCGA